MDNGSHYFISKENLEKIVILKPFGTELKYFFSKTQVDSFVDRWSLNFNLFQAFVFDLALGVFVRQMSLKVAFELYFLQLRMKHETKKQLCYLSLSPQMEISSYCIIVFSLLTHVNKYFNAKLIGLINNPRFANNSLIS